MLVRAMYYYNTEQIKDYSHLKKSLPAGTLLALLVALLDILRYELFHQRFIIPLQTDLTPANFLFLIITSILIGFSLVKIMDTKEAVYTAFFTAMFFYIFNSILLVIQFTYLDYHVVYDFIPIIRRGYPQYNPSTDYIPVLGILLFTLFGNIIIYIILVFPTMFGLISAGYITGKLLTERI